MTCSKCGAEFEGKFCPQCGAAAGEGTPPSEGQTAAPPPPPPPTQEPVSQAQPAAGGMTDNVAGTLCYVLGFITGIIFLVLEPYSKNKAIRFHAFQSIILSVALIVLQVAVNIILPWTISLALSPLISLAAFILWIYLLVKTYQGQRVVLPIIGPMAEKQA